MHRVVSAALFAAICFIPPASAQQIAWERTAGPYGGTVTTLESIGDRLYAGTLKGLFVSVDGGRRWQHIGPLKAITGIVEVDGVLIASTETAGVYRSTDLGETWFEVDVPSRQATSITRTIEGSVVVGTGGNFRIGLGVTNQGGLFRSVDAGMTWQEVSGRTHYQIVWDVIADTSGSLYAATFDGLLKSNDGGETWSALSQRGHALYSDGAGLVLMGAIGRIYRSTDSGNTWSLATDGLSSMVSEIIQATDGSLYAGTYWNAGGAIYRSIDGGITWDVVDSRRGILALEEHEGGLLAGTEFHGVLRSTEGSTSWEASNEGLTALPLSALHVHAGDTVFAGTELFFDCDGSCPLEGTVYRSVDGGHSWDEVLRTQAVTGFSSRNGSVLVTTATGLLRSSDGGHTWIEFPTAGLDGAPTAVHEDENGTLYLGIGGRGIARAWGIYRSSDEGESWELISGNEEIVVQDFEKVGPRLFAAAYQGVYRLKEEGGWEHVLDATAVGHLEFDGALYAAGDSLYRSIDGETWSSFALPAPRALGMVLNSKGEVFIASRNGLFGSSDEGATWKLLDEGWSHHVVTSGDHLVVDFDRGFSRSVRPVVLSSRPDDFGLPSHVRVNTPYPNPFKGSVTLPMEVSSPASVSVKIYDILGREVAHLVDAFMASGRVEVEWNAEGFPGGIYIVRFEADGQTTSRLITLLP